MKQVYSIILRKFKNIIKFIGFRLKKWQHGKYYSILKESKD